MAVRRNKLRLLHNHYYISNLNEQQLSLMEKIYKVDRIDKFKNILNGVTLRDFQTIPVGMATVNPRFFIGDAPGLGKTVEVAAIIKHLFNKGEINKVLMTTKPAALYQIACQLLQFTGLPVLMLYGNSRQVEKTLEKYDYREFPIILIPHSALSKGDAFLKFLSTSLYEFDMFIFDESGAVKNPKSQIYLNTQHISNNVKRVIFLNGTPFENHIDDFYYQLDALDPNLLPSKTAFQEEYCIRELKTIGYVNKKTFYQIVGYKNQSLLADRLRYSYISRTRKQVYNQLPKISMQLIPVDLSKELQSLEAVSYYTYNSPMTYYKDFVFNRKTAPKVDVILDLLESLTKDTPVVIYVWNRASQQEIKRILIEEGYSAEILSGEVSSIQEKGKIIEEFNNGAYDVLLTNIYDAVSLPASNHMIFYDLPETTKKFVQMMGRIDRNNDSIPKSYYVLAYKDSKEVKYITDVLYNREINANLFTNKDDTFMQELYYLAKEAGLDVSENLEEETAS